MKCLSLTKIITDKGKCIQNDIHASTLDNNDCYFYQLKDSLFSKFKNNLDYNTLNKNLINFALSNQYLDMFKDLNKHRFKNYIKFLKATNHITFEYFKNKHYVYDLFMMSDFAFNNQLIFSNNNEEIVRGDKNEDDIGEDLNPSNHHIDSCEFVKIHEPKGDCTCQDYEKSKMIIRHNNKQFK